MNKSTSLLKFCDLPSRLSIRVVSTSSTNCQNNGEKKTGRSSNAAKFNRLQNILSKMKVDKDSALFDKISKYGNSDLFNYATNKKFSQKELIAHRSDTWDRITKYHLDHSYIQLPWNGFQELITLTEQGKLWKYPIDNEMGMNEKNVPFEEHVFLDEYLKDFPKNEYIHTFMGFIVSGLAKNHWMTVERKREIIKFYKDYFEDKKDAYKAVGFEM